MDADLLLRPVHELAALVRGGQVSPRELTELALARIDALDGEIGAFVEVDAEGALAQADAVDPTTQPFAGIPLPVKANTPVAGRLMDYASGFIAGHRAGHDAYLVRRLRRAGFVIVGMTNLPEFGILPTTEPRHHGPTRNPFDHDRTPGGSSGGAAAAVASGMVPVAHGNDGGGSIRIPAACCGLVGLKPARGRVSRGPDLGDSPLTAEGVLTRNVADTALLLDVLAGYEVGDATWAPTPQEPFAMAMQRDPGALRIGFSSANPLGAPVDPECERGMHVAAEALEALGHDVFEVGAPAVPDDAVHLFTAVFGSYIALGTLHAEMIGGRTPQEGDIEPMSLAIREAVGNLTSYQYLGALSKLQQLARTAVEGFAAYDVLLTPALAERPLPIGEVHGCGEDPLADFARSGLFTPFTALYNVTGQPAITVPVDMGPDGLPTSVQLVGRPICEDVLLQLAAQIERVRPSAPAPPASAAA